MANNIKNNNTAPVEYNDDSIKTLSPREHLRLRPGMYIGKLGDGSQADDGIYVLIKETVDNSIDEFVMGIGKKILVSIDKDGLCEEEGLTPEHIGEILAEEKANQREKIRIPAERIRKYFPKSYTTEQIEEAIIKICESRYRARRDRDAR